MKIYKKFFVVFTCFFLLFLLFANEDSHAACSPAVKILGESYAPTSIQNAYDYASFELGLSNFTLLLAGEIFTENLLLDGGSVILDGGYDCSFTTKNSKSSILGTITISDGAANFAGEVGVVSTDQCDFDRDFDGYTSIGSCFGTADDCNDNDASIYPGAAEICDGLDNNCDGQVDEGAVGIDADGDGYYAIGSCGTIADDCNDNDASIHPGAVEIPYDGIDQDCNGTDMTFPDASPCGSCHGILATQWTEVHDAVTTPDGTCAACHAAPVSNILPGHYGRTVSTAGNNMSAGSLINCASCHDQNTLEHPGGAHIVWGKVEADWPNLTCDTCHENRAADHDAAHDNRVITDFCASCHTSDTSVIGQPGTGTLESASDVDALHRSDCTLCHGYTGTNLDPAVVAQAIQAGITGTQITCLTCHSNFGTVHAFLDNHNNLVNVGTTSCGNCHSDPPPLTDPVDPKVHSTCSNCHDSNYNTISLAAGKSFALGGDCTTCHTDPFDMVHPGTINHTALVKVGTTSCGNCHSDPPPLIDPADPKVHDACSTCHDAEGGLLSLAAGQSFAVGGDCATCHTAPFGTIHPADTDHSGIVTTTGTKCGTCHTSALLIDSADPKVHDGCFSCHDTNGGLIGLAIGKSAPGNCNTCHGMDFTTIHPDSVDHSALVKVSTTSCGTCHSDPPPLVDPADSKVHNACSTCHDSDGGLINKAAGKSFDSPGNCTTCHTDSFDTAHPEDIDHSQSIQISINCDGCHTGPPPVVDPTDSKVHDACITCHDANGVLINLASGNTAPNECITCHGNDLGSLHPSSSSSTHEATPGSANVLVFAEGQHDSSMVGAGEVYIACSTCHSTDLGNIHDNNCATCHSGNPSPYDSLGGSWTGGCQQGGCHTTYHADATVSHWSVADQCSQCHNSPSFDVPDTSCANCHAGYSPSDTMQPETSSDVQPSYVGMARIDFSMTDNGKVGIGTFYSQIDGGAIEIGSSKLVDTIGSHTLEFWGVDQAGNEEIPHNTATFVITEDVTPPVTVSNASTNYYNHAYIALSATDNGSEGVKATYYSLNGGPIQTYQSGNFIFVAQQPDTANHTLEFWSEDWDANVEITNIKDFTVYGKGTLRLVWYNSDTDGSPCLDDPEVKAQWTIRQGGTVVATGSDGCPDWSGVNDVVVTAGQTYSVSIDWWDSYWGYWDNTFYAEVNVSTSGEVVQLPY